MFPRIVAADFHTPMHVSEPCQHLLRCMLTADPEQRITIQQVLQHPWLQTASPPCTKVRTTAALCASRGCACTLVSATILQKRDLPVQLMPGLHHPAKPTLPVFTAGCSSTGTSSWALSPSNVRACRA